MEINPGTTYTVKGSVKLFLKAVAFPHALLLAPPRPLLCEYRSLLILCACAPPAIAKTSLVVIPIL